VFLVKRQVVWLLKGVGSNCVTQGEREIYLQGVPLSNKVHKEVELWEEVVRIFRHLGVSKIYFIYCVVR
jgi:hypothetical protein